MFSEKFKFQGNIYELVPHIDQAIPYQESPFGMLDFAPVFLGPMENVTKTRPSISDWCLGLGIIDQQSIEEPSSILTSGAKHLLFAFVMKHNDEF